MIELPYLKNIIPNKCTSHRTAFTPSSPIDTEVFQKMLDVKSKKGEPIPYELDSDGCVVILVKWGQSLDMCIFILRFLQCWVKFPHGLTITL